MTYKELLEKTAAKKADAVKMINGSLNGPAGWLVKAELERDPGAAAWGFLAGYFCRTLAENFSEIMESLDEYDQLEVGAIYMAYEDDRSDLYDMLPVEAQLFTEEV